MNTASIRPYAEIKPTTVTLTRDQIYAIQTLSQYMEVLQDANDFSENTTVDDGYLPNGQIVSLTIDDLRDVASILNNEENN